MEIVLLISSALRFERIFTRNDINTTANHIKRNVSVLQSRFFMIDTVWLDSFVLITQCLTTAEQVYDSTWRSSMVFVALYIATVPGPSCNSRYRWRCNSLQLHHFPFHTVFLLILPPPPEPLQNRYPRQFWGGKLGTLGNFGGTTGTTGSPVDFRMRNSPKVKSLFSLALD